MLLPLPCKFSLQSLGVAECSVLFGRFPFGKPESAVTSCPCRLGLDCITADPHQFGVEGARGQGIVIVIIMVAVVIPMIIFVVVTILTVVIIFMNIIMIIN